MTSAPEALENRILVLAPTGRDAALIGASLRRDGLACSACESADALTRQLKEGAGAAMFAEEALVGINIKPLVEALDEQPPWSDFPLIFLTKGGVEFTETSARLLSLFGRKANVTILERPLRVATLLSSVRSALRARRRQYEVRDYLDERKRSAEKLLQTQKLESLGVLAGGVAHDFNNLLTGILGNASLAVETLPDGCASLKSILEDVVSASERAADLTRQLLAYAGKGRFVVEPVDLSATVREISRLVQSTIPKNAQLRLDLADKVPCIEADASQVQQVVMNLVINAAEAIPAGRTGNVLVTTSAREVDEVYIQSHLTSGEIGPGNYVVLEVRDTGDGMDEETKARIFDPFFTTKFMGRGLGLAAVLGIVRGHRGALGIYSSPGKGSVFRVLFPAIEGVSSRRAPKQFTVEPAAAAGRTILVIDDEPGVRRAARASLESYGYEVVLAENGSEGIDVFRALENRIAAVLLDLTMPGLNGEEVLGRLKAIRADVKVVLSSGFNEIDVVQRFTGKGLAGFIQKPYTSIALATRISDVVAG